ncbi:MAG: MotA/TolQ/ExbB proton channel family protein [Planctomycetota bacterium]|jgi:biopolymer transport protein ExbB/TolQ
MSDERDTGETLAFGGDEDGGSWLDELASDDKPKAVPATQAPAVAAQVAASQAPGTPAKGAPRPGETVGTTTRRRRRSRATKRFFIEFLLPVLIGLGGMLIVYELILPLVEGSFFYEKMTAHAVCWGVTAMLFWHTSYTLIRYFVRIRPEFWMLRQNVIPAGVTEVSDKEIQMISERAIAMEDKGGSILTRRLLLAVAHLQISRDTAELGDLLRRRAEADRQRSMVAYLVPKFLVWAMPIFGFIGTVLGIGGAVGGLTGTIARDTEGLSRALGEVAKHLGVAFDTTLVGLGMSFIALLVQTLIQRQEFQVLADVEDYLTYRLQSRIRTETQDVRIENLLREALTDMKDLQARMGEEQQERASIGMQTMMTANDSLKEALGSIPDLMQQATKSSADLMETTRGKLDEMSKSIRNNLGAGIVEVVEKLEEAVTKQAEMGEETMRTLDTNAQQLGEHLGAGFKAATADLDKSLADTSEKLGEAVRDGKQITELQNTLAENLDQLARVQKVEQTFGQVRESLDSLLPLLEKLNKPIPLKLTFGGVEIAGAGQNSEKYEL